MLLSGRKLIRNALAAKALIGGGWARAKELRRTAGYVGYVGHANLGDEVMWSAIKAASPVKLEVSRKPDSEHSLDQFNLGGGTRWDKAFLGGGTLISDGYLHIVRYLVESNVKLATLGSGVGSAGFLAPEQDISDQWRELLAKFVKIGVRGPVSRAKLEALGIDNVEVIGDAAMLLTPKERVFRQNSKRLIINFAGQAHAVEDQISDDFFDEIVRELDVLSGCGWELIPIACHQSDAEILARLGARIPFSREVTLPANFEQYQQAAIGAQAAISVRLHAGVLASMCGVPNLQLSYRDKCRDFMELINMAEYNLSYQEYSPLTFRERLECLITEGPKISMDVHEKCRHFERIQRNYLNDFLM